MRVARELRPGTTGISRSRIALCTVLRSTRSTNATSSIRKNSGQLLESVMSSSWSGSDAAFTGSSVVVDTSPRTTTQTDTGRTSRPCLQVCHTSDGFSEFQRVSRGLKEIRPISMCLGCLHALPCGHDRDQHPRCQTPGRRSRCACSSRSHRGWVTADTASECNPPRCDERGRPRSGSASERPSGRPGERPHPSPHAGPRPGPWPRVGVGRWCTWWCGRLDAAGTE